MNDLGDTCGDYPERQRRSRSFISYQDIGAIFDAIPLVSSRIVIRTSLVNIIEAPVCVGQYSESFKWTELD
jgi:hypothetical protein